MWYGHKTTLDLIWLAINDTRKILGKKMYASKYTWNAHYPNLFMHAISVALILGYNIVDYKTVCTIVCCLSIQVWQATISINTFWMVSVCKELLCYKTLEVMQKCPHYSKWFFNAAQFSLYQRTPLHIAAREDYLNTVKTLQSHHLNFYTYTIVVC